MEQSIFWYRVLVDQYEKKEGMVEEGGQVVSRWWKDIVDVQRGVGLHLRSWFDDNLVNVVGDGTKTLFCVYQWLKGGVLWDMFIRLYDLSSNKSMMVAYMRSLGRGEGEDGWKW